MKEKLVILRKLEDWLVVIHSSLRKFPKAQRFTLAQKIENTSLECIDSVISGNFDKQSRLVHIFKARVCVGRLQVLIRIARRHNLIGASQYEIYSEQLTELAKMLAGWSNATVAAR